MCPKFLVDWTSPSSKTTLTKNFNLKQDGQTKEQKNGGMDGRRNE